ncbi:MAG TPA: hypothetical protein VFD92_12825 [Candidatus Binatia bacterium]|nr:hypothetical protein [Candidatus Binatia bacterium]
MVRPYDAPDVAASALSAITRADAMGLIPEEETIDRLDAPTMRRVTRRIADRGIGKALVLELERARAPRGRDLRRILRELSAVLEDSPLPELEWPRLRDVLGLDLLTDLVGVSQPSVRRYLAGDRTTPDDVAARLHFVALVVGDLAGTYNEVGIRRWFERPRTQLAGRSPRAILAAGFRPEEDDAHAVARLSRSLAGAVAT